MWWSTLLIPHSEDRQTDFKASLVYKASSRIARATQRNPVSKQNLKKKKVC